MRLFLALAAISLAACTSSNAPTRAAGADADVVPPNANLRAEGIPPIPKALADRVALYTEFKPANVVAWHPTRRTLLIAHRREATTQLHLLDEPLGTLQPLTEFPDPVSQASFEPKSGAYLVYARDSGGNEASQLYRLDLATRQSTLLTDPNEKHELGAWNRAGSAALLQSTQLDRTAGPNRRETVTTDLYVFDPMRPEGKRKIASLPGGGWGGFRWGKADRAVIGEEYRSATESVIWQVDVATGRRVQLLPAAKGSGTRQVRYGDVRVTRDGNSIVYTSDEDGEFTQLMAMELRTGKRRVLSHGLQWDVDSIAMRTDDDAAGGARAARELAAVTVNVAGRRELRVYDIANGREVALPPLPAAISGGSLSRVRFAPRSDDLAITVNSAQTPGDTWSIDVGSRNAAPVRWTESKVAGIDTTPYRQAEVVKWKSFDGLEISGLLNRPPARFAGKRPVLISIHGGPEGQATIGFIGRSNYFVNELGIALLQPNVRGSTGYGKTFVALDNGMKREDSVKDIGALFDWIATQPDLDPARVMVVGGSYGGYMSLAVATLYPDRIAGSIDIVGISSFTSFLERTETYRRDLRRIEYGDERDPAMRAFFERISPLSKAGNIRKPLFVVQGLNDPRVPWQEADQIVTKVRAGATPVWYLTADNEGHGFARKPNADFQFYAQILFMQRYLLN